MVKAWKDMSPLERISKQAQDAANRSGTSINVYNLNMIGKPLYVMRDSGDARSFVKTFNPENKD